MGMVSHELSLDLKPSYVQGAIDGFLKEVSMIGDLRERLKMVDDYVERLEIEMKKIEVFKRELPLCMHLLNDAIVVLREESMQYKTRNVEQEFIPLKKESEEDTQIKVDEDCNRDKKNWLSSVQLWNPDSFTTSIHNDNHNCKETKNFAAETEKVDERRNKFCVEDLYMSCKIKGGPTGFLPIQGFPGCPVMRRKVDKDDLAVHGLSLFSPVMKTQKEDSVSNGLLNTKLGGSRVAYSPVSNGQSSLRPGHQQPSSRKQRRCWSPELHRRFVDALQQLGGAQVATPKQIRELMRVDGLTNDEVKSHLQKYRLHTRRVRPPSPMSANQNPNVLGSFWASEDQYSESSKPSSSQSGSPQGPFHFSGSIQDEDDEKSESFCRPRKDDV